MPLSPSRVAYRHLTRVAAPPDIREVLDTIKSLALLDKNLTEFEESFQSHFAATGLDPEVGNQSEALHKALEAIKQAEQAKKAAEAIAALFPADKTAPRAVEAADVMIKRFLKHAEEARKIIRRIAKKEMPADLKKAAASLKRALQKRLVNSSDLQEIPWVAKPFTRDEIATYFVYLVVNVPGKPKLRGIQLRQRLYSPHARYSDSEVKMAGGDMGSSFLNEKPFNVKDAVDLFAEWVRGWSGLKGEAEANTTRKQVSEQVAGIVKSWTRRQGGDTDNVEVSSDYLRISGGFRGNTRWEQESEWDADEGTSSEGGKYQASLKSALGGLMGNVKSLGVYYGEKGWWSVSVTLK